MSNYSVKESESNFELISEIGGDNSRLCGQNFREAI